MACVRKNKTLASTPATSKWFSSFLAKPSQFLFTPTFWDEIRVLRFVSIEWRKTEGWQIKVFFSSFSKVGPTWWHFPNTSDSFRLNKLEENNNNEEKISVGSSTFSESVLSLNTFCLIGRYCNDDVGNEPSVNGSLGWNPFTMRQIRGRTTFAATKFCLRSHG